MRQPKTLAAAALALLLMAAAPSLFAQDLPRLENEVKVHTLDNGWTFLIYERPGAPVFSFSTVANVGSAQEVPGITGLAHMFEHMAFKGTPNIGTKDYKAELKALEKVDEAYHALDAARRDPEASTERVAQMEKAFKAAQDEAREYVKSNEFDELVERNGGVGMNATTQSDATIYYYSLPSNKMELFAYLESERFMHPVLREFYMERDVVQEERRMRVESTPFGRLLEQFVATAYIAHPYKSLGIGAMSDLKSFTREDAKAFYDKYYVPSNMTTAIVGDVKADELIPVLDKYFGRIPKGPAPPELRTVEPPQNAEKIIRMPDPSQPIYAEAYHKGAATDPDEAVFDAISDVLSGGRTSRLYRRLVRDEKTAVAVQAFNGFPGNKYPTLYIVFAVPAPGHGNEDVRAAIHEELERLKTEPITDEELQMVKTRAKAELIRGLRSNQGLANQLAFYQTLYGDWSELMRSVERIDAVTKEDILRVAKKTFVPTNRTVGMIETETEEPSGDAQGQ